MIAPKPAPTPIRCRKEKKKNGFGSLEVTKNKRGVFFAMKHRPGLSYPK